jgi:hypothetical protein
LNWILFKSDIPPFINSTSFNFNTILYVKQTSLSSYRNNIIFSFLSNTITAKPIIITFLDENNQEIGTKTEYYYSTFDDFVVAESSKGNIFLFWADETNEEIPLYSLLDIYEDITLHPVYLTYPIILPDD